jgi:hypothetical protein
MYVPVIAHLLAHFLHTRFERSSCSRIFGWERLIKSLLVFVVISILFLSDLLISGRSSSRRNRDAAVCRSASLAYGSCNVSVSTGLNTRPGDTAEEAHGHRKGYSKFAMDLRYCQRKYMLLYLPQEASPFGSAAATADTGVTLGEGNATDVFGEVLDLFVIERRRGWTVLATA